MALGPRIVSLCLCGHRSGIPSYTLPSEPFDDSVQRHLAAPLAALSMTRRHKRHWSCLTLCFCIVGPSAGAATVVCVPLPATSAPTDWKPAAWTFAGSTLHVRLDTGGLHNAFVSRWEMAHVWPIQGGGEGKPPQQYTRPLANALFSARLVRECVRSEGSSSLRFFSIYMRASAKIRRVVVSRHREEYLGVASTPTPTKCRYGV